MSNFTEEQLNRIEKNREEALLRKRKAAEISKASNRPSVSYRNNSLPDNYAEKAQSVQRPNVSAVCRLISESEFVVDMPFHTPSIEIFKSIPGKRYDPILKRWSFPITSHDIVVNKLQGVATISQLPKIIVCALKEPYKSLDNIDISSIDNVLLSSLLPFQEEGIRFGISRKGRCLIADDMGLGKTIQALGIAHYYVEEWPLLILCPSSMRFPWEESVQAFLPSVSPYQITVMTSAKDFINEAAVVICSYDMSRTCFEQLCGKKFGVIIMDESHSLKSFKAARTRSALNLAKTCRRVILLSGTPVLSRPIELYTQISAITTFLPYIEFGVRYCAGVQTKFGWKFTGSSNMEELEIYLKKKLMIRRLKSDVITQLPSKIRKVVVLNPAMVQSVVKSMNKLSVDLNNHKGEPNKETLLLYYSATATAKSKAVCEYISEKLDGEGKMLIFAHHSCVMTAICEMLTKKSIGYMKIDGTTSSDLRKLYCDTFQTKDECRVAVLSLKAANAGITLTAAQLVIFAELYWNPGELTQAEDRAHRIGQRDVVVVEYLVAKGTVDEYLWKLVQSKLDVLNKVGLSKDTFKEIEKKDKYNKSQQTITSMLKQQIKSTSQTITSDSVLKENDMFDEFFEGKDDDDFFQNINLDEIENNCNLENV